MLISQNIMLNILHFVYSPNVFRIREVNDEDLSIVIVILPSHQQDITPEMIHKLSKPYIESLFVNHPCHIIVTGRMFLLHQQIGICFHLQNDNPNIINNQNNNIISNDTLHLTQQSTTNQRHPDNFELNSHEIHVESNESFII